MSADYDDVVDDDVDDNMETRYNRGCNPVLGLEIHLPSWVMFAHIAVRFV